MNSSTRDAPAAIGAVAGIPTASEERDADKCPWYRLKKPAYFDAPVMVRRLDGAEVEMANVMAQEGWHVGYKGIPGPHMEPLNEAAIRRCDEYPDACMEMDLDANLPMTIESSQPDAAPPAPAPTTASAASPKRRKSPKRRGKKRAAKRQAKTSATPATPAEEGASS